MKALYAAIDDHIKNYENGTITISGDIEFSMHQTVRQITHYILSRYMGGQKDELGRRLPFRNIGNAIVDIEWRAKNIDRKSIEYHETDGDFIFSLVVNKELQQWMKTNNFGKVIDDYQRKKSEYGSVVMKKTETRKELIIEPTKWECTTVDPRDIAGGPKVEKNYLSPLDLKKKANVWTETTDGESSIDLAIKATQKGRQKDYENRIEVLDIEAEFDDGMFEDEAEEYGTFSLYSVIIAVVSNKKYLLYKDKLSESRFKHDARKAVEGRDMGLGVWEEVFEPQIWTNEAVISEKFAMDLAGKVIIKTNKKNLPLTASSLKDGEMIDLDTGEFFEAAQLMPNALPNFQQQIDAWFINTQRDQSAFPGVTGEQGKAGQPFASLSLEAAQGGSIFNKRRDQDGYFISEMIVDWVMPFVVKRINAEHKLTASYSVAELKLLDEAIKSDHANRSVKDMMLSPDFVKLGTPIPTEAHKQVLADQMQAHLDKTGSKRTLFIPKGWITMEKISTKGRFDITDEMMDDQRRLNALATTLQALPPDDPARVGIIQEMMEISGASPASFPVNSAPAQTTAPVAKQSRVSQVLPDGQKTQIA